jgi:hypothetical protein
MKIASSASPSSSSRLVIFEATLALVLQLRPAVVTTMEIFVKIKAWGGATIALVVDNKVSTTIADVQAEIQDKTGTPPDQQMLMFEGKRIWRGSDLLSDHNIQKESTLLLLTGPFVAPSSSPWGSAGYSGALAIDLTMGSLVASAVR